ncbi:invasion associated locus B family protein [Martelella soudanensis]|uniref:invasion associated locus B family protein n=1 Tax=unclassified Martelella TaxID=2629616 RepID=UPI0015DF5BF9|nr:MULTISPECIES: invasion associated locus B family protein [unclassified Martelella]
MKPRHIAAGIVSAFLLAAQASPAFSALPEGASSINETYQDWRVTCISNEGVDRCAMIHNQVAKDSGQRVMTVELSLTADDKIQGVVIMPFGLALAQGVTLTIDAATEGKTFGFSTCLPQGCLAPVVFDAAMAEQLKNGTALNIIAQPIDGNEKFSITASLRGFTAAYKRLTELR